MANSHLVQYLLQLQGQSSGKSASSYSKAINSLKLYPLPIRSGQDALILEGVGKNIADKLDAYFRLKDPSSSTHPTLSTPSDFPCNSTTPQNHSALRDITNTSLNPTKKPSFKDTSPTAYTCENNMPFKDCNLQNTSNNLAYDSNTKNTMNTQKTTPEINNIRNTSSNERNNTPKSDNIQKTNPPKTTEIIILDDDDETGPTNITSHFYDTPAPIQKQVPTRGTTYNPRYRSPPWAILVALAQHHQECTLPMNKSCLHTAASKFTASIDEVVFALLEAKGMISPNVSKDKYSLTENGKLVANNLLSSYLNDKENIDSICNLSPRKTPTKRSKSTSLHAPNHSTTSHPTNRSTINHSTTSHSTKIYSTKSHSTTNHSHSSNTSSSHLTQTHFTEPQLEDDDLCHKFSLLPSPSKKTAPPNRPSSFTTPTLPATLPPSSRKTLSMSISSPTPSAVIPPSTTSTLPSSVKNLSASDPPDTSHDEPNCAAGTAISSDQIPRFVSVLLILDNREVRTKKDRDYMHTKLASMGISAEVRSLSIGDAMWVAVDEKGHEWVLDYIVERKKVDDLCASIIDGRYSEQKFRLAKCGCTNKIYVVEGRITSNYTHSISPDTLESALASTQVQDDTIVKQTLTIDETIQFLAMMTSRFTHLLPTTRSLILGGGRFRCSFSEFGAHNSKNGNLPLTDLFAKQLMQIPGISGEKAFAVSRAYPTPTRLISEYNKNPREASIELLSNVQCGRNKRKLGSILSRDVYCLYTSQKYP